MDWLATGSCLEARQFGWLIGNVSGLCVIAVVTLLIMSSPAFHRAVPSTVNKSVRVWSQWLFLKAVPVLLFGLWLYGGWHAGAAFLDCYATALALGALAVVAPIMLLLMFSAANQIGRMSVR
jgi:hypothetical protein